MRSLRLLREVFADLRAKLALDGEQGVHNRWLAKLPAAYLLVSQGYLYLMTLGFS
ncbi:hypothetical protein [Nostoc sp. JL31]|uniref:hypothetical protein n=1 Tax=Nostoc sp. JL31 TaxID=2815395 RepID=UPI0026005EC9|nr:hypothetical protein [Nostoc sp. JL31]